VIVSEQMQHGLFPCPYEPILCPLLQRRSGPAVRGSHPMCYTLDMRELSITRSMTRAIIAAEKNLEEAIAAIMATRVEIPKPEMCSGVLDDVDDDGYKLIFETDWTHLVNRDWIDIWLGVAAGTGDEAANVDDWDAGSTGLSECAGALSRRPKIAAASTSGVPCVGHCGQRQYEFAVTSRTICDFASLRWTDDDIVKTVQCAGPLI